jgi:hypothetical protein
MLHGFCRSGYQQFGFLDNVPIAYQVRLGCALLVCDFMSTPCVVDGRVTDGFPAKRNRNVVRFGVCANAVTVMQDGMTKGGQQIS